MCMEERGGCDGAVVVTEGAATVGVETLLSFEPDEGLAVPLTTSDILFSNTSPVVVLFCEHLMYTD